jgi:hypothetical protein
MRLTAPKTHKADDLRGLYEEFKVNSPAEFQLWLSIERSQDRVDNGELFTVQSAVYEFLKSRTLWDDEVALVFAWMDFRSLLSEEFFGYSMRIGE